MSLESPHLASCQNESLVLETNVPVDQPAGAYAKKLPVPQKVYVIDFFCGCGGMSAGFLGTRQSHFAFEILAGIDINDDALATYKLNIGAPAIRQDIRALAELPERLRDLISGWDPETMRPLVFAGCPPCQGFSALRKGDDRDDLRNDLSFAFARLVEHYRPDMVVMENVPEILKGRFSHHFDTAAAYMEDAGYELTSGVLDLSLYGVPQRRRRAVVLGALNGAPKLPKPVLDAKSVRTVRDAIAHLRPLGAGEIDPEDPVHRAPAHTDRLVAMFAKIPANGGDRRSLPVRDRLAAHRKLDASATPGFTDVYGRLRWDSPSVTITAKSRSPSSGRFLHPEQHRNITVREAALLQGFPHGYMFAGTPTQQYRQIGEAVPPIFARSAAWAILDHISSCEDEAVPRFRRARQRQNSDLVSVDCFCGAGGLGLGFAEAGIEAAIAFDLEPAAVGTYSRNLSTKAEVLDVTADATFRKIEDAVAARPYILVGGPPCQGFSHQRRGDAEDPRNQLVIRFAELALRAKHKPRAVILENVTDLDLPRGKHILAKYKEMLSAGGYTCFRHDLNSADYGVPQLRNRIIVVALIKELSKYYEGPSPLTPTRWSTVGDAFAGLAEPSAATAELSNHSPSAEGADNRRRIAFVEMGHGRKSIPLDLQLPCHANNYRGHRDVYGRLDWFSQARTLTAGFDSFTRGEYAHPFAHRSITPREAARIQGFPDWFEFVGTRAEVRRQIGNAVPPPMAFAVAEGVLDALRAAEASEWAA